MIKDCRYLIKLQQTNVCESEMVNKYKWSTNFYEYSNENKTEHNLKWPYYPDHPYRILITIGGSESGKN